MGDGDAANVDGNLGAGSAAGEGVKLGTGSILDIF